FADRTYQADGSLTSRSKADALIADEKLAVEQVLKMVTEGKVLSQQNTDVSLRADTVCIHGDGAHALDFVRYIRKTLENNHINVTAIC
ncbi:LamB/YcsF family protein, partial [Microvirga sp. 3-52]|nr:LamB/YcsF family protein [Microvirga sp. 3-52]